LVLAVALVSACQPTKPGLDHQVRLNEIQVGGTHNSYHVEAPKAEEQLRGAVAPADERTLEYDHPALPIQLSTQHVRQVELDIHLDSKGGLFAHPYLRQLLHEGPLPYQAEMEKPGIKVLHIHDVDYLSNCPTFIDCLQALKSWSDAHPKHLPIMVLVTVLIASITTLPANLQVHEEQWTAAVMPEIDRTIRSVLPAADLITPDDVRGRHPSLEQALRGRGWPTVARSRGRFLFTMDNHEPYRSRYLQAFPEVRHAVLFVDADPPGPGVGVEPWRAFVEMTDPTGADQAIIQRLVREGYVVRTRADADTVQARSNDTSVRDAALASGAQWVSTDYPAPGIARRFGSDYWVGLPSHTTARCNPINGPKACTGHDAQLDAASP
jgi:hypothetical protein